jgi:type 1 glutamine amidotransferase
VETINIKQEQRMENGVKTALAMAATSLAVMAGGACAQGAPTNGNLPPGALPSSWDPTYNVCRGTDPKCYNDWIPNRQNKVLIFSRTAGPRHANIGSALGPGLNPPLSASNVAQAGLIAWLAAEGIQADWTEDVTRLPGNSATYKAVIFLSNSRDVMWAHGRTVNPAFAVDTTTSAYLDQAKVNLRQFVRGGGGFVAIHNAFGTEYNWPWYEGLLGNANYYNHGAAQNGTVNIVGAGDASTAGVPTTFAFHDEWYNLVPYPTKVKFLATVDESTLATKSTSHPGHGNFHPVAWCQYYDGGKAWLTTLGHDAGVFAQSDADFAGAKAFQAMVVGAIKSVSGQEPFCR